MRQARLSAKAAWFAVWLTIVGLMMLLAAQMQAVGFPLNGPVSNNGDYLAEMVEGGAYRWTPDRMPLHVYIADGSGVSAYRPQLKQLMRDAFNSWMQAAAGKLSWVEVSDPRQADIVTNWSDSISIRNGQLEAGRTTAVTQTDRRTGERSLVAADVKILTRIGAKVFSDDEIRKTTLHEIGHALGLQGHSHLSSDIMYASLSRNQVPFLQDRDAATISHLYAGYPLAGTDSGAGQMARRLPPWLQGGVPEVAMSPRPRRNVQGAWQGANAPFAQFNGSGVDPDSAPFAQGNFRRRRAGGGYGGGSGYGGGNRFGGYGAGYGGYGGGADSYVPQYAPGY
ncbi:MAG: matrixin family metalloprotease [Candidatus Obscuribacterales bacterium]